MAQLASWRGFNDFADVAKVFLFVLRVNKDVVEKDHTGVDHKLAQNDHDELLEHGWGVAEAEGHDEVLQVSASSAERGLPFITFSYSDLVIGVT
jgi:hypothetical protein